MPKSESDSASSRCRLLEASSPWMKFKLKQACLCRISAAVRKFSLLIKLCLHWQVRVWPVGILQGRKKKIQNFRLCHMRAHNAVIQHQTNWSRWERNKIKHLVHFQSNIFFFITFPCCAKHGIAANPLFKSEPEVRLR